MNSSLFLATFACLIASSFAVKCFVCSSLSIDRDAKEEYKKSTAYSVRSCQKSQSDGCATSNVKTFSIADYYLGQACSSFDSKKLNSSESNNIVECAVGCAKIQSNVADRGEDKSRITRQCAFYDNDVVGKYINQPGFKRTGAGSDKVANWFYYCNTDFCNTASGDPSISAYLIASFCGLVALINH